MTAVAETGPAPAEPLLVVQDVTLRFGGLTSLDTVSLDLHDGEILAVIGPNGAGKTSLFNCLAGVYHPSSGSITFRAPRKGLTSLLGRHPFQVNHLGIARTFQNIRLFPALSALDNVKIGVESRQRTGPIGAMLRGPRTRREQRESDEKAIHLLDYVGLRGKENTLSAALSYGDQRRLEIARALATEPKLLLLDEPAAGMNPSEKLSLEYLVRRIRENGVTVLLIEHDVRLVMALADRVVVLNFGKVIASGRPQEIQRDPAVVEAYLGTQEDESSSSDEPGGGTSSAPGA